MFDEIKWAARHVLASRVRRRALLRMGTHGLWQLARFLFQIVPQANAALDIIGQRARRIEDAAYRTEALASIGAKSYHVAGAAFLATFLQPEQARRYIEIVAPLESLYDYLDNLCDRHPDVPLEAYPVLHEALRDALDVQRPIGDYFRAGPLTGDGGYLEYLVLQTREALAEIAQKKTLLPYFKEACELYTSLQTYKHYPATTRVAALQAWHAANFPRFSDLAWWEFAAACGSQFHVYVLLYFALSGEGESAQTAYDAYFPEFCALHVLLDDFIDQAEDRAHAELNFISRYGSFEETAGRFADLLEIGRSHFGAFKNPHPHKLLARVLTLFYLTHPKIYAQGLDEQAQILLNAFG